ncbi:protein kinase family protein [Lactococcus lactis]|uniref:protein kinase family protein n=1 Tax=Lactococcus lactis TaxID=1358 RepID=UPI000BA621C3|nr:protein kinase family protein [Lactococcus lactis]MCT1193896.1 protein kinase family protein [Lactococcus lactis]PAK68007.1 serine/threonine protein kinase [Lactococcus lactis]PEN19390.1 serine/threonine protein kinase [Lactococcus lactis]TYR25464.1 protein kinase [Lactococcus lactis subsp. lactis bv. diacetylactis]
MTSPQLINAITTSYKELTDDINLEYVDLYKEFEDEKLRMVLSTLHHLLTESYITMNQLLPSEDYTRHFWAEDSRKLINIINIINKLKGKLLNSELSFKLDDYYANVLKNSKDFLSKSGGSEIPPFTESVDLYYEIPIFIPTNSLNISREDKKIFSDLKPIGEGSYASVYKYKDEFYDKEFVLKRAKKKLDTKELERFKIEYEQMKSLSSPYVTEVYRYNGDENEYIMECMDYSLESYLKKFQDKLDLNAKRKIVFQILNAFKYIHSKGILHRDISPKNILIKKYEDVLIIKVADFGLVKIPESGLTSLMTDFKGAFNDLSLEQEGFSSYNILHETYALTKLIYYTMTGRTNIKIGSIKNSDLKQFVSKGISLDKNVRYKNVDEMISSFRSIKF